MSNKKNIAIFIDSLGGGGAERVMLNLAKGLVEAGHYAHIFCLESRKDHDVLESIPVSVLYKDRNLKRIARGRYVKSSAIALSELVASTESLNGCFNLFLSNLDPTNAVVSRCDFKNVHYVLHNSMEHEIDSQKRLGPIKWFKKLRAKKVMDGKDLVAVSQGVAEEAESLGVIRPNSVCRIYNPSDLDRIRCLAAMEGGGVPSEPYLVHVGRVVKQKRHDILFSALSMVPDIKLVLLCKDIDKALLLAKKYGVEDRVINAGFTTNPYNWMAQASLMVLSSDFEGLPTVLIESLACGTPVVSTDCKYGPSEILTGEMADFLSPCGDAKALADNLRKALSSPPSISQASILKEVTMDKAVKQYIALAN